MKWMWVCKLCRINPSVNLSSLWRTLLFTFEGTKVWSVQGAFLWDWWTGTFIWFAGGWFGTSLDEASVKPRWKTHWERLLIYGLKLNFHRYIGQLRRLSPPHRKTPWRPLFIYKWHHVRKTITCTPSATIRTSRRTVVVERHGRRRTVLLVCNKVTNDDRTVI